MGHSVSSFKLLCIVIDEQALLLVVYAAFSRHSTCQDMSGTKRNSTPGISKPMESTCLLMMGDYGREALKNRDEVWPR